ncbi:MAG TPA: lysine 2,3-aminomutase, partial [Nitrospiraceae bacterium]
TNHFRTTVETGLQIIKALQGHTSGLAVPHFVIDAPGGGGKIPLLPGDYLVHMDEDGVLLKNYENKPFHYPQPKNGSNRELPMVGAHPAWGACSNGDGGGFDKL